MYAWLGICLALALLFLLNTLVSLLVSLGWRVLAPRCEGLTSRQRARLLFLLRVLPGLAALGCVGLLLPAYFIHERPDAAESVSLKLALLAALSSAGLALALWRGLAAWWTTRKLLRNWMSHSTPLKLADVTIPAYRLTHPFPVLAIVGLWRPRLFIAEQLLSELSADELQAALKHEMGHLAACDNFKRVALRASRDVLTLIPSGRHLDLAWNEAAEEAADEYAVTAQPESAFSLAAALVKIARIAPHGLRAAMPAQASFIASQEFPLTETSLSRRVKRLLQLSERQPVLNLTAVRWRLANRAILVAMMVGLFALAFDPVWLATLHEFNELVVLSLQ